MSYIQRGAKSEEVRKAAGHTYFQWNYFKNVTKEQAELCTKEHPHVSWGDYMPGWKQEAMAHVNAKLAKDDVPQVTEEVLAWKLRLVIRDSLKSKEKESAKLQSSPQSQDKTAALQDIPRNKAITFAPLFDPVRDLQSKQ